MRTVAGGEYFDRNVAAHVIPIQAKYMFNIIFVWAWFRMYMSLRTGKMYMELRTLMDAQRAISIQA